MKNLIIFISLLVLILTSCETKKGFDRTYGRPKYKVILLNSFGDTLRVKYAHEMTESLDWGMHKNYSFKYYVFVYYRNSTTFGLTCLSDCWEWSKYNVRVEPLK